MRMVFRWFGEGNDTVSLEQIKQIPGVEGIVWALHDLPAGEEWPMERIEEMRRLADRHGLHIEVVESVNVHEDIKLGLPTRDRYIGNYIRTVEKLAKAGVKVICYNFMPVFDWVRTELHKPMEDGSTALFFEQSKISGVDPFELVRLINENSTLTMPGWEPERLEHLTALFEAYRNVTAEDLWANLKYFLDAVIPVAEEHGVLMAVHPDDPPWPIFGLPRILTDQENFRRFLALHDSPSNGITLCSGSLGANPDNDIIGMIHEFSGRIPFAHIRNVKVYENGDFIETSHRTSDGSVDIRGIVKAYYDIGFKGYCRPDHGRHLWGEICRPGYGLYDRALGIMYLWGLWDAFAGRRPAEQARKEADGHVPIA
ncbi:mannonate dehydratase [Paenibacillus sp. alder61]|uniref:mannonate dehydratase n=1 Tax=Paenibacillus sp. alder61 TaxID=2862948 RepID=UPI001CD42569|nr:mannonate dehydratase [Paenibacillus sp. alder61]MCA1293405.1 mannonate dehydratase [Paenibacillus sp. alder61]